MTPTTDKIRPRQYIGPYRVIAPVGIGASASVFRAVDQTSGNEVAVKVLADNHSLVPEMRQRFLDEIDLLMAIDSPAVATVFDRGETQTGQPYLVLELADRGDLRHRLDRVRRDRRTPNAADLLLFGRHLAAGLSALHEAGIVHRDLSPGNVLISGSAGVGPESRGIPFGGGVLDVGERYLLADLGFAKDLALASGLTVGGGTRGFAAPEQRDVVTLVDHRADVYGATALVAWMADGTDLGRRLEHFVATGTADDPDRRHRSMTEWLTALELALSVDAGTEDRAVPGSRPVGGHGRGRHRGRAGSTRPLAGLVVGCAVIAALLVLGSDALDNDPPPDVAQTAQWRSPDTSIAVEPTSSSPDSADSSTTNPSSTSSTLGSSAVLSSTALFSTEPVATGSATTTSPTVPPRAVPTSTNPSSSAAATVTTLATTITVPDPGFAASPRAFIEGPADEAIVSGDLRITGSGRYREGLLGVELVIRRLADDHTWHDSEQSFQPEWVAFPLDVSPSGGTEVTWSYTLDRSRLEPGRYMIRVWATGTDANDPVSDRRHITITR